MALMWDAVGNLPAELTSFVGRDDEVADVARLLSSSRLVTLTGVAGVGKTRLALRAATRMATEFADGVWFVQLDRLRDEALVPQAIAAVLGLQERAGYSGAAALLDYVADRELLLLLDNCEHLAGAVAQLVTQLQVGADRTRVLATSREPLDVPGETTLQVAPLLVPEPEEQLTAAELARFPAIALFLERAAEVVPGFVLTDANKAAVAGICHRSDGLPLAIELATAHVRVRSPEEINELLSDRLSLLTRGSRSRSARQQTLRASIAWSYELCSDVERQLWARLSVFAGGCEMDAVEGICAGSNLAAEDLPEVVTALVDKSVLTRETHDWGTRYRLLEVLREYGQERLREAGEYPALRRRHRDWYEQLASQADAEWLSPRQVDWMARLEREHSNVQAALDFCQTELGEGESALRILKYGWHVYYWAFGYVSEGRYRFDQALARAHEPTVWRARGLLVDSLLAVSHADRERGLALLDEGVRLAERLGDPATLGVAGFAAGNATMYGADVIGGIAQFESGLAALSPTGHDGERADCLLSLGIALGLAGHEEQAIARNRELLALTEANGELFLRSYSLWALALSYWRQGDLVKAGELARESLRLRQRLNDRIGNAFSREALAWFAAAQGQYERAAVLLGSAARLWRSMAMDMDGYLHLVGFQRDCYLRTREALGEAAFQVAYDHGTALADKDAVAFALQA